MNKSTFIYNMLKKYGNYDKKEVKQIEKQPASTKNSTSTNPALTTEELITLKKSTQKTLTDNATNSTVNIEQNQVDGESKNTSNQLTKGLENAAITGKTNHQPTIVQSTTENQQSNYNPKIPAVPTKCQGETLDLDNENSKSIVLKSSQSKFIFRRI